MSTYEERLLQRISKRGDVLNAESAAEATKVASVISHVKANRTEYLIVLIFAHMVGLTDKLLEQTSGMCL